MFYLWTRGRSCTTPSGVRPRGQTRGQNPNGPGKKVPEGSWPVGVGTRQNYQRLPEGWVQIVPIKLSLRGCPGDKVTTKTVKTPGDKGDAS